MGHRRKKRKYDDDINLTLIAYQATSVRGTHVKPENDGASRHI